MSIQVFCPFFNWVVVSFLLLSCMSYLYILEIQPLWVAFFATIFSHSIGCLFFFFLMVFFAMQKLVSLIRSHMFIFVFTSIALGDWPKDICTVDVRECFAYVPSCRSFMVSCLMFKFLSYFEFIFVRGVRVYSSFTDYMQLSSFPSTTYWLDPFFPMTWISLNVGIVHCFTS